ncbi:MAG: hypothetical protein GXP38_13095, partial [Chloroflexi bacterium]|nr:hypothetical protein [Chloroflexota bacterium]
MNRSFSPAKTRRAFLDNTISARLALAIFLFVLYLITGAGAFHIIDEVSLYSATENLARRGAWNTDQIAWSQWVNSPAEVLGDWGHNGHVYSKKGPAPILAFLPLRYLAGFIPGVGLLQVTFLSNALITILTALFLWAIVRRLGYDEGLAAAAALIFGVGTLAWPYATHLFGEPLSALALTVSLWAIIAFRQEEKSRYLTALGVGLSIAVASSAAYSLFVPMFILRWWQIERQQGRRLPSKKHVWALLIPLLLCALGLFLYNIERFGHVWTTGYHFGSGEGFSSPLLSGLYGLLFSPYRGIFYHQPLTLLALAGLPLFWRRHRHEALLTMSVSLLLLLVFAKWWIWWGGFAWGPRFLMPLAPYLVLWML